MLDSDLCLPSVAQFQSQNSEQNKGYEIKIKLHYTHNNNKRKHVQGGGGAGVGFHLLPRRRAFGVKTASVCGLLLPCPLIKKESKHRKIGKNGVKKKKKVNRKVKSLISGRKTKTSFCM